MPPITARDLPKPVILRIFCPRFVDLAFILHHYGGIVNCDAIDTIPIDGIRGEQRGNSIVIFMKSPSMKNARIAAQTVIHETTHVYCDIGYCQWAEAVCMAKEQMHIVLEETV